MKKGKQQIIYALICAIPLFILLILNVLGFLKSPETKLSDAFYQSPKLASPDIYVIGIDEPTLSRYGSFTDWSREKTAELIELLSADPENAPAVIAVDIGFYSEKDPAVDERLTAAVKKAGNVVLVSTATFGTVIREDETGQIRESVEVVLLEEPYDALKEAAAAVGHVNIRLDDDGVARHAYASLLADGKRVPSFPYAAFTLYRSKHSQIPDYPAGNGDSSFYIAYTGMPRAYFGEVGAGCSLYRVLSGEYPASAFKDAVVFVGAYSSGLQDNYYTTISGSTQMNGVEIHANLFNQMLDGVQKTEITGLPAALLTILIGAVVIVLLTLFDAKYSIPASLLLGVIWFAGALLLSRRPGWLLPLFMPLIVFIATPVLHVLMQYIVVRREKNRIVANYGKYLSPDLAAVIAEQGEDSLRLGGTKKDIAVLFVDIRGFTTLSESLPPEKVVEMLNSYLSVTTEAIFHQKGTVDKFIGDATMGVFNAPLDLDDYTYRAVLAGLEMAREAANLDEKLAPDLRGRVGFGVGINCGEAVVGNVGTPFRMEYTAIGDTVNTASRLEGQAKAGVVIISEAVYSRVKDRVLCEDLGYVRLKGKADEVHIYRALEKIDGK